MNEKNQQRKNVSMKNTIPIQTFFYEIGFQNKQKDGQKKMVKTFKSLSKPVKSDNLQKNILNLVKQRQHKRQKKKVGFKNFKKIIIKTHYNFGFILKSISIRGADVSSFKFSKEKSIPFSIYSFLITDQPQSPTYRLVSSIIGNQYVLFMQNKSILTILFDLSCGLFSKTRSIRMYMLKERYEKEISDSEKDHSTNTLDPFRLWNRDDMADQIEVYESRQAMRNKITGACCLPFSEKKVRPSVYNSILVNESGQTMFEFYCIQNSVFQVKYNEKIALQFIYAFVIASLDFKLLVQ